MLLGVPCMALSGAISLMCMLGSSLISDNVPSRAPGPLKAMSRGLLHTHSENVPRAPGPLKAMTLKQQWQPCCKDQPGLKEAADRNSL